MKVNRSGETESFTVKLSTLVVCFVVLGVCVLGSVIFAVQSTR